LNLIFYLEYSPELLWIVFLTVLGSICFLSLLLLKLSHQFRKFWGLWDQVISPSDTSTKGTFIMILLVHARCIFLLVSANELAPSLTRPAAVPSPIHGRSLTSSLFRGVQVSAGSYRSLIHPSLRRGVLPAWHSLLLLHLLLLLLFLETEVLVSECDKALSLQHEREE
jgi:hypothetical protein